MIVRWAGQFKHELEAWPQESRGTGDTLPIGVTTCTSMLPLLAMLLLLLRGLASSESFSRSDLERVVGMRLVDVHERSGVGDNNSDGKEGASLEVARRGACCEWALAGGCSCSRVEPG